MKRLLFLAALAAPLTAQTNRIPQVTGGVAKLVPPSPTPDGFIADVPNIIPADAKEAANAHIKSLQAGGFGDIGVAILPTIGDYRPYEVGLAIYRSWKIGSVAEIGSAHRDVGLLLLIVIKELSPNKKGECWITTGTGAEGIMTDAAAATICRERIIPFLKDKNYGGAVIAGVTAMGEKLRGDAGLAGNATPDSTGATPLPVVQAPEESHGRVRWWHVLGAGFLGLGGLRGAFWVRRNRPRRCRKCASRMTRLDEQADDQDLDKGQQMEEHLKSVDYDVWHCTNCDEILVLPYKSLFSKYGKCKECKRRTALTKRTVLTQPTYSSRGLARDDTNCKFCGTHYSKQVVLPKLTRSSSSSGGSSGGGGSSFGGSGSSSGGGGGSSY